MPCNLSHAMHACAGGLPIGAVLVSQKVADAMNPGDHGSTFAGSPLVTRVAATTFDIIRQPDFLASVQSNGERLMRGLKDRLKDNAHVKEVRGLGLIVGVQLDQVRVVVLAAAPQCLAHLHLQLQQCSLHGPRQTLLGSMNVKLRPARTGNCSS